MTEMYLGVKEQVSNRHQKLMYTTTGKELSNF